MTDLLAQVTPLTKGIIWLVNGDFTPQKKFYKEIDYLLNGLLTATLNSASAESHVLVSENFGSNFYVLAAKNLHEKELKSFAELVKPQLTGDQDVLVIDESSCYDKLKSSLSSEFQNHIRQIQ